MFHDPIPKPALHIGRLTGCQVPTVEVADPHPEILDAPGTPGKRSNLRVV